MCFHMLENYYYFFFSYFVLYSYCSVHWKHYKSNLQYRRSIILTGFYLSENQNPNFRFVKNFYIFLFICSMKKIAINIMFIVFIDIAIVEMFFHLISKNNLLRFSIGVCISWVKNLEKKQQNKYGIWSIKSNQFT